MTAKRNRPGTTLVELIVTLVVLGIFGLGLTRLMTSQSRFLHNTQGLSEARRVARGGVNALLSDLRVVESSRGIVSAKDSVFTARVPWWFGISCGPDGGNAATHVSMPPLDSVLYVWGTAGISGHAYIDVTGLPHYTEPNGSIGTGSSSVCAGASVDLIPGGRLISISPVIPGAAPGLPVFLFQRITYRFGTSWDHWPQRGLFRTIEAMSLTEEVASPFDSTAHFEYYVAGSAAPVANPTAGVEVFGVDLGFVGLNRRNTTGGRTEKAPVETAVYFKNR